MVLVQVGEHDRGQISGWRPSGCQPVAEPSREMLAALKEEPGKDIWLMGGGSLFASLLEMGVVDTVEVSIIPMILGAGIPLVPPPAKQAKLKLTSRRVYETSGIVSLEYAIE